jgi:catechol 2,3-dioxygenase-like lactoylglutathione lyase family enzyme
MGIELVSVIVRDYDEAIEFFVRALGFFVAEDSASLDGDGQPKRWVVVKAPGASTGILLAQARGEEQVDMIGRQFAGRVGLFLRVDDFDEAYERMSMYGVQFHTAPRTEPYGQVAVFSDLYGNKWDLLGPSTV